MFGFYQRQLCGKTNVQQHYLIVTIHINAALPKIISLSSVSYSEKIYTFISKQRYINVKLT